MVLRRDSGRLAWGIILLAAGVVLLLGNFGYLGWIRWDRWWPLILIAIGLWMLGRRPSPAPPGPGSSPSAESS